MKKTLLTLTLLAALSARADLPVVLTWDANPPADNVTTYRVYETLVPSGTHNLLGSTGSNVLVFPLVLDGLAHVYTATASNAFFESPHSLPASAPTRPAAPTGLTITRQ